MRKRKRGAHGAHRAGGARYLPIYKQLKQASRTVTQMLLVVFKGWHDSPRTRFPNPSPCFSIYIDPIGNVSDEKKNQTHGGRFEWTIIATLQCEIVFINFMEFYCIIEILATMCDHFYKFL